MRTGAAGGRHCRGGTRPTERKERDRDVEDRGVCWCWRMTRYRGCLGC